MSNKKEFLDKIGHLIEIIGHKTINDVVEGKLSILDAILNSINKRKDVYICYALSEDIFLIKTLVINELNNISDIYGTVLLYSHDIISINTNSKVCVGVYQLQK